MLHFIKFATDKEFSEWQFANNKNIISIMPCAMGFSGSQDELPHGHVVPEKKAISCAYDHGVMVTYSDNRALDRSLTMAAMALLEEMVLSVNNGQQPRIVEAEAMIETYKRRKNIAERNKSNERTA
jgi:hypothetical protein